MHGYIYEILEIGLIEVAYEENFTQTILNYKYMFDIQQ